MFSLYRTISLRYLSRRWFRALLIVASIMLGVATLVATQALSDTMTKAALASSNPIAGTIDLIVTNGELPIDRELKQDIEKVSGVSAVHLRVFDQAKLIIGDEKRQVMIMGIDLASDEKRADITTQFVLDPDIKKVESSYIAASVFLETPAIVGTELSKLLEKEPSDAVLNLKILTLEKNLKRHRLLRVATVAPREAAGDLAALGGYVVILDLDNAATVLGIPKDKARRIDEIGRAHV